MKEFNFLHDESFEKLEAYMLCFHNFEVLSEVVLGCSRRVDLFDSMSATLFKTSSISGIF